MKKWNIDLVKEFVEKYSSCRLLSTKYVNSTSKLLFECECGKPFEASVKVFIRSQSPKRQCNTCGYKKSNEKNTYTIQKVSEYVSSVGLTLLSASYKNCKTNLDFECECGNRFKTTFDYIKNGNRRRCFVCQPKEGNIRKQGDIAYNLKTHTMFLEELQSLHGNDYEVLDEYKSCKHKIRLKHTCGNIWEVDPDHVLNHKRRCPQCFDTKNSKISADVERWLIKKEISFKKEYRIEECRYKRPLPFDFAIFYEDELVLLIEVDGQQHYDFFRYINNEQSRRDKFELTKLRDNIKDKYCLENKISLLRIPYFEIHNVDEILTKNILIPKQASESKGK